MHGHRCRHRQNDRPQPGTAAYAIMEYTVTAQDIGPAVCDVLAVAAGNDFGSPRSTAAPSPVTSGLQDGVRRPCCSPDNPFARRRRGLAETE
jgi:hypothetical protein